MSDAHYYGRREAIFPFVAANVCLANNTLAMDSPLVVLWYVCLPFVLGICHPNVGGPTEFPAPAGASLPNRLLADSPRHVFTKVPVRRRRGLWEKMKCNRILHVR